MKLDRRTMIASTLAASASPALGARPKGMLNPSFPSGFLWGAATAGHQVEGNNVSSDQWLLETVKPALASVPSGDADNSFELWRDDLDLVKSIGLNAYRFSIEWPRIEPEPGMFSRAMLNHYKMIIDECHARGLTPVVTFCHFTTPRWFAVDGGFTNPQAPALFARYCDNVMRHLGAGIGFAATFNEPNIAVMLGSILPAGFFNGLRANLAAAERASGSRKFVLTNTVLPEDQAAVTRGLILAHKAARDVIKKLRPDLPVGFTLSMFDDQAAGAHSVRDVKRAELYGAWLKVAQQDDFMGVQNYERKIWGASGPLPPPRGARLNFRKSEVYPASLAGAVRYAHSVTRKPIMVTEHGVGTDDDTIRAWLIPEALRGLKQAIDDGVPVLGYIHWSLLDNYEWGVGYEGGFGLASVDRMTFKRTPKPSASVLAAIARKNSLA